MVSRFPCSTTPVVWAVAGWGACHLPPGLRHKSAQGPSWRFCVDQAAVAFPLARAPRAARLQAAHPHTRPPLRGGTMVSRKMYIGEQLGRLTDERLTLSAQLGVEHVAVHSYAGSGVEGVAPGPDGRWEVA